MGDTTIAMEFSEPLSAPGGAGPSSFRLSLATAVELNDTATKMVSAETRYDVVMTPEKRACLAECGDTQANTDCERCDGLPAEIEITAVRYGDQFDQIHLELSERPSTVDCAALQLTRTRLRQDAEDRGLSALVEVGFMVHYAGANGHLRFDGGRTLGDQGSEWVTQRDDEAHAGLTQPDAFLSGFDVRATFDCYGG